MASYLLLCCHIVWKLPKKSHLDEWVIISIKIMNMILVTKTAFIFDTLTILKNENFLCDFQPLWGDLLSLFPAGWGEKIIEKGGIIVLFVSLEENWKMMGYTWHLFYWSWQHSFLYHSTPWDGTLEGKEKLHISWPHKMQWKRARRLFSSDSTLFCAAREHF